MSGSNPNSTHLVLLENYKISDLFTNKNNFIKISLVYLGIPYLKLFYHLRFILLQFIHIFVKMLRSIRLLSELGLPDTFDIIQSENIMAASGKIFLV